MMQNVIEDSPRYSPDTACVLRTIGELAALCKRFSSQMDMGHFFFTQLNPAQPIVPAPGPTKPTHLTAKQIRASVYWYLIRVWHKRTIRDILF